MLNDASSTDSAQIFEVVEIPLGACAGAHGVKGSFVGQKSALLRMTERGSQPFAGRLYDDEMAEEEAL